MSELESYYIVVTSLIPQIVFGVFVMAGLIGVMTRFINQNND